MAKPGLGKGLGHLMKKSPEASETSESSEPAAAEIPIGQGLSSLLQGNSSKPEPEIPPPDVSANAAEAPASRISVQHPVAVENRSEAGNARFAEMLGLAGFLLVLCDTALVGASFWIYAMLPKPLNPLGMIGLGLVVMLGGIAGAAGFWLLGGRPSGEGVRPAFLK